MSNERPNSGCLVVAPRPVRLSRNTEFNLTSSQNLPTEALEEFLSILKPTFLTMPRSYNFTTGFDRVSPLKHLTAAPGRFSPGAIASVGAGVGGSLNAPGEDGRRSTGAAGPIAGSPSPHTALDRTTCTTPIRGGWFSSSILSSPVSRMQTRNPFARNIDARSPVQIPSRIPASPLPSSSSSSSASASALAVGIPPSPTAIPLPLPSPDEMHVLEAL